MEKNRRQAVVWWLFTGALVALSVSVGVLQYRWIGEVSRAEQEHLRASLQTSLNRLSQDFNAELTIACTALLPDRIRPNRSSDDDYAARFAQWHESSRHNRLFRTVALAIPANGDISLRLLNMEKGYFERTDWPADWRRLKERLAMKLNPERGPGHEDRGPAASEYPALIEIPWFAPVREGEREVWREREWLIVEVDTGYVRSAVLPELLKRYFGRQGGAEDYQVEVVTANDPPVIIFRSSSDQGSSLAADADASIRLFEVRMDIIARRSAAWAGMPHPLRADRKAGQYRPGGGPRPRPGFEMNKPEGRSSDYLPVNRGRWIMFVRHRSGSLEAVVANARWRNLAATGGILVLLIAAGSALVRFTRRAQRLAELQMEFVAGVSHELRTPLSVMRTAGHNLRGRVASDPSRVQQYGALIEEQSERLAGIVEQVLRFANVRAGRVTGPQEALSVSALIDSALEADREIIKTSGCRVEKRVDPDLPDVMGDANTLSHALRNLIGNAAKYGRQGGYIGVFASVRQYKHKAGVEIRIVDQGPGIPSEELEHIFDPFYRGRKALEDQVHGTGLGLSLARRMVEAHHGTIAADSIPGRGTQFRVFLPAAPVTENVHELTHSVDRG